MTSDLKDKREHKPKPDQPIRLLALDVDGTVLDANHQLDPIVKDAIHQAIKADIRVVLCTGRRFRRARAISSLIGLKGPMVCNSGALVKCPETNATLWRADHKPADTSHLFEMFKRHGTPALSFLDSQPDAPDFVTRAYPSGCALFDEYLEYNRRDALFDPNWLDRPNAHTGHFHLCAAGSQVQMQKIEEDLKRNHPDGFQIFVQKSPFYVAWMCEVLSRDASKWIALKSLAQGWGIKDEEVCAVGDDANDVPMIARAGWGVAMGHAADFVKAKAHWIAPSNADHGVAEVIRIVLESQK